MTKNIFYAQSGGVTAVINASACGVIETARKHKKIFGKIYAGRNGIVGGLNNDLIDTNLLSSKIIRNLNYTPAGAFGSCRYKLKSEEDIKLLLNNFKKNNIGYFFYNGGGDSQDTTHKISEYSKKIGYDLICIGIPKTVDNDLPITDNCPGFGSVAKYVAVSIREAGLDVASMCGSSTKVFILEVMGRHAGWIAAATGLACEKAGDAPHIILFPEILFNPEKFLKKVELSVKKQGYCVIVVSEGLKNKANVFLAETGLQDAFGHAQLGGVAPQIAELIKSTLNYKCHWAVSDYLQRSARHIASKTDVNQAYEVGKKAVEFALKNKTDIMTGIIRLSNKPYRWKVGEIKLSAVANQEKFMPKNFITPDGFHITPLCREYLLPLIVGEDYPKYKNGLPEYVTL